jgi:ferrous iron transport protein A
LTVLPLGFLSSGQTAVIKDIAAGSYLRGRLFELGFVAGAKVCVVQNQPCGPLMVALGNGRVVIGRGEAQKIMVEEVGAS